MINSISVPAGRTKKVAVVGRFFRCKEASAEFELKVGNDTYTLEGGDEFDHVSNFTEITFKNLSADDALLVTFFASPNVIKSAYVKLPRTILVGREIDTLADQAIQAYYGVVGGKRRKQFTVTLRKGIAGHVLIFRRAGHQLVGILGGNANASTGFAIETDDDLQLQNETGLPLDNTDPNDPDIAVAETFYR